MQSTTEHENAVRSCANAGHDAERSRVRRAVLAAKRGDAQAVQYLYSCFAAPVRNYVSTLLGDQDAAEDVMQTTFMKLLISLDRYEPSQAPFEAWLLRVARNTALDEVRKQRPTVSAAVEEHPQLEPEPRSRAFVDALSALPVAEREVLVLRHVIGLSQAEVASRLERTQASVESLHERGRHKLRRALANVGPDSESGSANGPDGSSRQRQLRETRASATRRRSVARIAG
jgi:RNA polymerase sigma-70 factor, ECF subfamily